MLARLLARWRRSPAAPVPPPAELPSAGTGFTNTAAQAEAAAATPYEVSAVSAWHLLARRPAVDSSGAIAGFELRLSDWALQRLTSSGAQRTLQETFGFALVQAARAVSAGSRRALVSPVGLDDFGPVLAALPRDTILIMGDGTGNAVDRLAPHVEQIRRGGIKVAAPAAPQATMQADYGLLDAARLGSAEVLRRCGLRPPVTGGWIAINLQSFDEVAEAVRLRATLAYGRLAQTRPQKGGGSLTPPIAATQVGTLLSALAAGKPPRELADFFKADVTLSYRLLRYLSMAGVGQGRKAVSIQDAVMLLGTNELHRWLCVLLADSGSSPIARALHETALARGRLLELMALRRQEANPEGLFVLGAFSLLDLLLDVPLEAALALAPLPEPLIDALIAESGPWRPYLDMALALEACEASRVDEACARLHLSLDEVVTLNQQAAQWSSEAAVLLRQTNAPGMARREVAVAG
jgi:EAL and modified HD-GYP domain-containing signal transduction protein